MTNEDFLLETEDENLIDNSNEFSIALEELRKRCTAAKVELQEQTYGDGQKYVVVKLPAGRDKRQISLHNAKNINAFLSVLFEKYVFIGEYAAICSYEDGYIEAAVRSLDPIMQPVIRRLSRKLAINNGEILEDFRVDMTQSRDSGDIKIELSFSSEPFVALNTNRFFGRHSLSLKISGLQVSRHDKASEILERLSRSLFFQVDLLTDIPLGLIRERQPRRRTRSITKVEKPELLFPKRDFDEAPISLYWYARSAAAMPLLQFLAYYQSIEFYFPSYSQIEARRRLRNILKEDTFRPDRDADLGRILSVLKGSSSRFGDECSQLKATLQECIDPTELREFIEIDSERKEFFSSRAKGLTDVKLTLNNPSADIRNEVADRIYDIRCKIVHTKAGGREGEFDLLLPFSKEADLLFNDIELIQYIARQVLIAASSKLDL